MALFKKVFEKIVLLIITISVLISFCVMPASYAKLDLEEGEFYYAGTTKGTYTVSDGIFSWLLENLAQIADWILGIITMGTRMVFVGWTALIERLLTWALETTAGVNMENQEISNTDLWSVVTSTNNVTVQAIVYNQVPAFNINFFNSEYDKHVSPTGSELICKKCGEKVENCCTDNGDGTVTCDCECKGQCDDCKYYAQINEALKSEEKTPIIIQLKKQVAIWYHTIRLLAMAAMLVVLIGIGIKMVISTIASEKAVYKRMLIDWAVGALLLFTLHYIMYFTIIVNEILVDTVKESANSINKVQMMQLAEKSKKDDNTMNDIEVSNEELEIDIYEEVRTRAYDAKLSNGLVGMIMYMALVYMAIRYSLIYIKRYFTVVMLAIMGPGVGVAYAIEKAMTGKSKSLKKWLSEFIMNVIIQTVHAIIYAVFISSALVLSLESVAGIIVALLIMNYSLKAEKVFRKIFNLDAQGSGLLSDTENAGDLDKKYKNAFALYKGGKAMANAVTNTPYAKVLKTAGRVGLTGGILAGTKIGNKATGLTKAGKSMIKDFAEKHSNPAKEVRKNGNRIDKEMDKNFGGSEMLKDINGNIIETTEQYDRRRKAAEESLKAKHPKLRDKAIASMSEAELKKNLENAQKAYKEDPNDLTKYNNLVDAYNDYQRHEELSSTVSSKDVAAGHVKRIFDIENYYELKKDKNGKEKYKLKKGAIFGTKHKDPKTGNLVSDKNSVLDQFRASNLLGFTEQDSKVFKENVLKPIRNGFIGTASMFAGMSMFVVNPNLGMKLLAGGPVAYSSFKKLGFTPGSKKYKGRKYNFKAFSVPTIKNMSNIALDRARREQNNLVVNNVIKNHRNLAEKLKSSKKVIPRTLGVTAGFMAGGALGGAAMLTAYGLKDGAFKKGKKYTAANGGLSMDNRGVYANKWDKYEIKDVSEAENEINKQHFKQLKTQQKEFQEETLNVMGVESAINMENSIKAYFAAATIELYKQQGYKYNPETGELTQLEDRAQEESTERNKRK